MTSLDLALVGNGTIGALVSPLSEVVWACFPRFDGDPVFCSLLRERAGDTDFGLFAVDLIDVVKYEQAYLVKTPMLVTLLHDRHCRCAVVTYLSPWFRQYLRLFF